MPTLDPRIDAVANPAMRLVASLGEIRTYPRNAILLQRGRGKRYRLRRPHRPRAGQVSDVEGHEMVLGLCEAGDLLGEMSLDGGARSASAITLEPSSCAIVAPAQLRQAIERDADVAFHLLTVIIGRARMALGNVASLALLDACGRIVQTLDRLAQPRGSERVVTEPLAQQQLGERAGVSRDMVNRIFRDLATGGHITVNDDRTIVIHRTPPTRW